MNLISTRTLNIPLDKTDYLYPNVVYTFKFTPTQPIKDVNATKAKIEAVKDNRFDISNVQVTQNLVQFEVKPRLAFEPTLIIGLLPLIGVAIATVVAFIITSTIPSWMYGLLLLGLGLAFLLPKLKLQKFTPFQV